MHGHRHNEARSHWAMQTQLSQPCRLSFGVESDMAAVQGATSLLSAPQRRAGQSTPGARAPKH